MDNAAHVHLLFNHFPIVGAMLALPVLLLAMILRKERGLLLAGVLLLVSVAVMGYVSVETGEKAMDQLSDQPEEKWAKTYGEAEDDGSVAKHEDRAHTAMWFAYSAAALGILVLGAAHVRPADKPIGRAWIGLVLLGAIATSGAMAYAGNAGGVIMHREIRGDSLDSTKPPAKQPEKKPEEKPAEQPENKGENGHNESGPGDGGK